MPTSSFIQKIRLPNLLADWPYPRHLNPHYSQARAESSSWIQRFHAFRPSAQRAFDACDFNLLSAFAYPNMNEDQLRTACDFMNLVFVFDEQSDLQDDKGAQLLANIIMDALRNPHTPRPLGEPILGEIARQFWERAIQDATPSCQKRFIETFELYASSVVEQAHDRTHGTQRDIATYFDLRRETIGATSAFALLEMNMNLPDHVLQHPIIVALTRTCIDLIILGNDLYSYNVEQARGDEEHNLLTIVMKELSIDVHGAIDWLESLNAKLVVQYASLYQRVPSWREPIDSQLREYVHGIANWVRANEEWSFESQRYFGEKGPQVQKRREIALLPKKV